MGGLTDLAGNDLSMLVYLRLMIICIDRSKSKPFAAEDDQKDNICQK
jgi:hypothetical protein